MHGPSTPSRRRRRRAASRRIVGAALALLAASFLVAPGVAWAEPYLAAYAGVAFTEDKDLRTRLDLNGVTLLDGSFKGVEFDDTVLFGVKVGYFFDRVIAGGNLGLEVEAFHLHPDSPSQRAVFSGIAFGLPSTFGTVIQKADIELTAVGLNLLYRLPLLDSPAFPGGRLQPYAGVGLAVVVATLATTTTPFDLNKNIEDTDARPALQILGGLKFFLTRHIALFSEYKFVQTDDFRFRFLVSGTRAGLPAREFARDQADLTQHYLTAGIAIHWR
jgi:opacity protein-like surface antigen